MGETSRQVRVRYAPSPTGHLHIGGARTALFNYLFARNQGGKFIIRIEDTDQKRNVESGERNQLEWLRWIGIEWDEGVDVGGPYGPYRQTERLDLYREKTAELLEKGVAYRCYCTEEELEREREEQLASGKNPAYSGKCRNLTDSERASLEAEGRVASIRFRVPAGRAYTFTDLVRGEITFDSDGTGDFVIVKKDGIPTYNYAVVIDDHLMQISHVLRGEEHISNTPRQLMLYETFGWEPPHFGHMTMIVNEKRKKLSKRDESIVQFIEQYAVLGYLPEAVMNFLALLGWSPEGTDEIFSRDELIRIFNPARLSTSPAMFDTQKLAWMNNHYIKQADPESIIELALPYLQNAGRLPQNLSPEQREWAGKLIALYQEQLTAVSDIVRMTELFFRDELELEADAAEVLAGAEARAVLASFKKQLSDAAAYEAEHFKALIKAVQKETGQKGKALFMPIRAAATGQTHGRDLNETLALLGKEVIMKRLAIVNAH